MNAATPVTKIHSIDLSGAMASKEKQVIDLQDDYEEYKSQTKDKSIDEIKLFQTTQQTGW